MSDKLTIAIIGLGQIGASAGLALRRLKDRVTVIGHDRDPGAAGQAKKLGAVDRTEWNLINAVTAADRILLATPLSERRATLAALAADLKPGCVIVDTATVAAPVTAWAAELLPPTAHFIAGRPILLTEGLGPEAASADLFEKRLFCLAPTAQAEIGAIRLAADLVEALGAQPYFLDPIEHDGLTAAVEHLPALLAAALATATAGSPSWGDMRKLAGSQFYSTTLTIEEGAALATALVENRQHVARRLDALLAVLDSWRQHLDAADVAGLAGEIERGATAGREWLTAYRRGTWDADTTAPEMPTTGSVMRNLWGLGRRQMPEPPKRH